MPKLDGSQPARAAHLTHEPRELLLDYSILDRHPPFHCAVTGCDEPDRLWRSPGWYGSRRGPARVQVEAGYPASAMNADPMYACPKCVARIDVAWTGMTDQILDDPQ